MAKSAKSKKKQGSSTQASSLPFLQDRLILNRFLCAQFGCEDFRQLRNALQNQKEGWAEDGHSYFFRVLEGLQGLRIPADQLADYDQRIKGYVERLNRSRSPQVQLKYFQYLAVLFAEIYLHRLFDDRASLQWELNKFVEQENKRLASSAPRYEPFEDADLSKLAFWMATGSGKTLIMHINLWQYLHYSQGKTRHENVLLITPNEGLSQQHLEELRKSGIPAKRYEKDGGTGLFDDDTQVTVIEITKLTKTKQGGGLSVEVSAFGANNLLFVDEGHRGASGEVWRDLRSALAEQGFTFEYSATFGQIVNGANPNKREGLLKEYSKAILFDYSYPYFYHDGYGKDYWITNLQDSTDTFSDWMLLGNLLSFYEQCLVYEENRESLREYNLEKPLWVFVGHTVTGGNTEDDKESLTDVGHIVDFFNRFLTNDWSNEIAQVLQGQTGLKNRRGEDIFTDLFPYLKEKRLSAKEIYQGVIERVFSAQPGEKLRAVELKNASGEIGLCAGAQSPYFAVINIGDVAKLMKQLEEKGIARESDTFTSSLFTRINDPTSEVNVLIGSRKFMEGWDSFRVSSMGLMNIGKGEGAQIIQLFGRGVRLRGKGFSLKRSSALAPSGTVPHMHLLETLYVFGVRANYMAQFREYLKQEGIETDFEEVRLPIQVQEAFLQRGLQVLRLSKPDEFKEEQVVVLEVDGSVKMSLNLLPRVERLKSEGSQEEEKVTGEDRAKELKDRTFLYDWQRIYYDLLEFKRQKGYHNLSFTVETLRKIIEQASYQVYCPDGLTAVTSFADIRKLEDVAIAVLRKYVTKFYERKRREWQQDKLELTPLTKDDPNLNFGDYVLRVKSDFVERVRDLVKCADEIYKQDVKDFPNIHFDRHLYQPLLMTDMQERIESSPPGLNEGEAQFVRDLRTYLQSHKEVLADKEVFLLRNLTRGKGIGFFEADEGEAFYPDFILWVIQDQRQWIIFIDPHGLRMARGGFNDPKIRLHKEIKQIEQQLHQQGNPWQVHLDSFIIAQSDYEDTKRYFGTGQHSLKEFEEHNILFAKEPNYIQKLFRKIFKDEQCPPSP